MRSSAAKGELFLAPLPEFDAAETGEFHPPSAPPNPLVRSAERCPAILAAVRFPKRYPGRLRFFPALPYPLISVGGEEDPTPVLPHSIQLGRLADSFFR